MIRWPGDDRWACFRTALLSSPCVACSCRLCDRSDDQMVRSLSHWTSSLNLVRPSPPNLLAMCRSAVGKLSMLLVTCRNSLANILSMSCRSLREMGLSAALYLILAIVEMVATMILLAADTVACRIVLQWSVAMSRMRDKVVRPLYCTS
jgi:hypothetical protein